MKCQATATSYSDSSVTLRGKHTHLPRYTDREILEIRQNLKPEAIEESAPVDRLVKQKFHEIKRRCESNGLFLKMPSIQTNKNTVQKQRLKIRSALSKTVKHLSL